MEIDTYIVSSDWACLTRFCEAFPNVIGPQPGSAVLAEQEAEDGGDSGTQGGGGDPSFLYACIRSSEPLLLPEAVRVCDEAEGKAILGVWA